MQTNTQVLTFDITLPCRLNPVTSLNGSRRDNPGCIQIWPRVIPQGQVAPSSMSSVSKWQRFEHPEGQPYFVLTGEFDFVVVTDSDVEDVQTEGWVLNCLRVLNKELRSHDIEVPPRCELFLELAGDDAMSCNYYFVDHTQTGKGLFWLEDLNTELLGIPATVSDSHLELALERLYWVHVEFFPMHYDSHEQALSQMVDDLYNIISLGRADRLISRTSKFPYTADACKQVLKSLSTRRKTGQHVDGNTLCSAARLAGAVVNQRFTTYYGQQSAQLDSLHEVCLVNAEHKWMLTAANLLMWGIPQHYISHLEDLHMSEQVYADQWTHFMSTCLADWTNSLSWGLWVFMASILLTNMRGRTTFLSILSVLFCVVSIVSASYLGLRHRSLTEASTVVGDRYLHSARSNTLGFLPVSIKFSLPRAGFLWGVGFLITQFIHIVFYVVNRLIALVVASVIVVVVVFILCVTNPARARMSIGPLTLLRFRPLYGSDARQGEVMT